MMETKSHRYREILAVLARHGIAVAGDHFVRREAGDRTCAEHVRRACEELGPVFIKLGQLLSTRGDLLSDVYRTEFAKLQDDVAPLPAGDIAAVIREDLGAPPEQLFASFDVEPLGSASIGQVHAARLFDGRDVVLKVRKPRVDDIVRVDLDVLAGLIDEWCGRFPMLERFDARGLLREFSDMLHAELDYGREGANETFFHDLFASEEGFKIPAVIAKYSGPRVLAEERVKGRKVSEVADLPERRRAVVARRIARFVLEPAFECGVFYADPHPGNLLIQQDDSVCVIDFGEVGHLTPEARRCVAGIFLATARSDAQGLADRLLDAAAPTQPIDRDSIVREIERMLELYVDVSLEHVRFGDAIGELLALVRRHSLRLPGPLVLFFKAMAMCEGSLQAIDPNSSFLDYLRPMMGKLTYQTFAGPQLPGRLRDAVINAAELSIGLPQRIDRVLGQVERGNLRVWARVEDFEPLVKRIERVAARSNATILAAACIVGLAVVMLYYRPQGWQRWIGAVFWIAVGVALIDYLRTLWALRK